MKSCFSLGCARNGGNGSAPVIRIRLLAEISTTDPESGRKYYFDEALRQSEDIELWVRIALFKRFLPLARAYQMWYLARRAIRSGDSYQAIKLIHKALFEQPKILFEEPMRTIATYGCALLSILPRSVYTSLESLAMRCIRQKSQVA